MDPILIGTAVSEYVIREMSKSAVPLAKALWQAIVFINIHEYVIMLLFSNAENQGENKISASILADV